MTTGEQEVRSVLGNVKDRIERGRGEVMGKSSDQECEPYKATRGQSAPSVWYLRIGAVA